MVTRTAKTTRRATKTGASAPTASAKTRTSATKTTTASTTKTTAASAKKTSAKKTSAKKTSAKKTSAKFDYSLDYEHLDLREHPELYRVGIGEQGVLRVQPYKSELLPHWRFRTPELAAESSATLYRMFLGYLRQGDFVGADMARKFIQMGYTRARRYANHRGGKKYDGPVPASQKGRSGAHGRAELPRRRAGESDEQREKAEAAAIFKARWDKARAHPRYTKLMAEHRAAYG